MAVLVLGGYGLIGSAIVERLTADGIEVIGLGRRTAVARKRRPDVAWREADLSTLTTAESWVPLLVGVDVIVNAAGALQQGLRDNVAAVQLHAMTALYDAARAAGVRRIVQISAAGATPSSPLEFYSTKGRADAALQASGLDHVILRPGLVIAPTAYGGTALLRALAAFPAITPLVLSESPIQTVWIGDLVEVVVAAIRGRVRSGSTLDLVEPQGRSLAVTVGLVRGWLGLPAAPVVRLPNAFATMVAAVSDMLGWLGWRSPLRSTAMAVMKMGVLGDKEAGPSQLGRDLRTLPQGLRLMSAGPQELWFARLWLLKPLILCGLAAFWIASGGIGLARLVTASEVLTVQGLPADLARTAVLAGGVLDLGLGVAILVRPFCAYALRGTVLVSLAYLAGATILAPDLWFDPLGPMVKVFPAILLSLVGLAVLEER